MRLLEVLCCKNSSQLGPCKSCFSLQQMDASPSGHENHQPLEVLEAVRPFYLDNNSQTKGMPSGEAKQSLSFTSHLKSQGQPQEMGCRDVARGPRVLKHPLVDCQVQEVFFPQGRSDWGHLATLGAPEMGPGRADWGLGISWDV